MRSIMPAFQSAIEIGRSRTPTPLMTKAKRLFRINTCVSREALPKPRTYFESIVCKIYTKPIQKPRSILESVNGIPCKICTKPTFWTSRGRSVGLSVANWRSAFRISAPRLPSALGHSSWTSMSGRGRWGEEMSAALSKQILGRGLRCGCRAICSVCGP